MDIETAPHLVYTWGLWDQNISLNQIVHSSYILCWAAKWHGESKMMFSSREKDGAAKMIRAIHKLLSEADVVVHYNGQAFDIPRLNQEFSQLGLKPPAPFKQVDLFRVVKKKFDLPSNKLEYVVQYFGLGAKVKHSGMELWIGCLNKDPKCWELMEKYNKGDVTLLEKLYNHLLPWIDSHPNHGLFGEDVVCTNCASPNLVKRGVERTLSQIYQRFQCSDCGKWLRSRKRTDKKTQPLSG